MPSLLGRDGVENVQVQLSPALLVRLARDLLVCRGHRSVRQTDGPGDGGRDVYSIAPDGSLYLTQCKHHEDRKAVCGSGEVSELPMALVKFGIAQGLFITDARISPQAKREFLNDYPQLKLEFLDFEELVGEVLSRAPLRALWFDGGRLGAINTRVTFPVLVRRHSDDRPVLPLRHAKLGALVIAAVREEADRRNLTVEARESPSERGPFGRYRLPRRLTMEEGAQSDLRVTDFGFKGGVALYELQPLAEAIASRLASSSSAVFDATTVLVGRAFVTPLEGDDAGLRTLTDVVRTSAVGIGGEAVSERRWFLPDPKGEWDAASSARASQGEWIRLYHPRLDVALAYEIVTSPEPSDVVYRQFQRTGWNRSVFALVPTWKTWAYSTVPEPDDQTDWTFEPGHVLCAWFHPLFSGSVVAIAADHGDEAPTIPVPDGDHVDVEVEDTLARVRAGLGGVGDARLVAPERARHMVALMSSDPLPADDVPTIFRTAEVISAFRRLASPIDPAARRCELTIAWNVGEAGVGAVDISAIELEKALHADASVEHEGNYVVLTLRVRMLPVRVSTRDWVGGLAGALGPALLELEAKLSVAGVTFRRATAEYWWEAYLVRFGVRPL
jgi:Restriction endonuclease